MKLILIGCVCALGLSIAGCGKKSDDNNNPVDNGYYSVPVGNYVKQQDLDPADTSRYTVGCAQPGSSTAVPQIDPRVKNGTGYDYTVKAQIAGSVFQLTAETAVTAFTATTMSDTTKFLSISGVPGVNAGDIFNSDCTLANGQLTCITTPNIPNPMAAFQICSIVTATSTSNLLDKGTFTTSGSNTTVNAFRATTSITGTLNCSGVTTTGTVSAVFILSNEIPAIEIANFCGGTSAFASVVQKTAIGTADVAMSMETTGFTN